MVVVPQPTAVARLGLSGVSNIAIATLLDAHVTRLVRSVLLDGGEYTPSAMNWAVSVTWGMVGLLGKRVIDCSTGGPPPPPKHVLVNPVCPTMLPSCALIVVVPQPTAVARPVELMVATLELLDDQVTVERSSGGRLWFVVPIARNCVVCPICDTLAFCGITAMETRCWLLQPITTNKVESPRQKSDTARRLRRVFIRLPAFRGY
jgi:hypothetical protein